MANTFTAPFAQHPKTSAVALTVAVTDLATDAPGGTELLVTAGPDGAIVTVVAAIPRDTVTASSVLLFLSKDGGVTQRLIMSELMGAHTVEATTAAPVVVFEGISETSPIRLEAGDELYVGTGVAGTVVASAQWTDY